MAPVGARLESGDEVWSGITGYVLGTGEVTCFGEGAGRPYHAVNGAIGEDVRPARKPRPRRYKIQEVITMAGLKNFIDQTIDGTETQINGGGKSLSLGIRRRIALARALATEGKVMIIDEPTEGLDGEGAEAVLNAINAMAQRGCTVVVFSHDPQLLQSVPHYIDLNVKPVPSLVRKQADARTISDPIPAAPPTEKADIK